MIAVIEGDVAIDICRVQLAEKKIYAAVSLNLHHPNDNAFDYQERIFFAPKTFDPLAAPFPSIAISHRIRTAMPFILRVLKIKISMLYINK
jgi:hypothetical protein